MKPVSAESITKIEEQYPGIPEDYLEYLRSVGAGEHEVCGMIYEAPIPGTEISTEAQEMLLVGDDMAGFMIGYVKTEKGWEFRGLDSCGWEYETLHRSFSEYLQFMES